MGQLIDTPKGMIEFPDDMAPGDIKAALDKEFGSKPTLVEAGWEGLKGDVRTGGARLLHAVGAPETARYVEKQAAANYAEQARRPITDIDEDWTKGVYEGVVSSLPSMAPVMAGAYTGAKVGAVGGPWGALGGSIVGGGVGGLAQFFGSNLKRQKEEQNVPLEKTDIPAAGGTAIFQASLDAVLGGGVFAGAFKVPIKMAGNVVSRMAIKALEGGVVEGFTEAAQQWLEVLQANPEKAFDMPPEVRKEIRHAATLGAVMGGATGGASGIKAPKHASSPVAEEPPPGVSPPVTEPDSYPAPGDLPDGWDPHGDYPAPGDPPGPGRKPRLPPGPGVTPTWYEGKGEEGSNWYPEKTGLPGEFEPNPDVLGFVKPFTPNTGQQVYKAVQQELLAAGQPPMQANATATLARDYYTQLGKRRGVDAFTAFKQKPLEIQGPGNKKIGDKNTSGDDLNQDPMDEPRAQHYSLLQSALQRSPMKSGTGQQWMNLLKKQGVKDEEMEWTGMKDMLSQNPDKAMSKDEALNFFRPYPIAVFEAQPHLQKGKDNHYGSWTLGSYGNDPKSNYREVVVSDEGQDPDAYKSAHWPKVPNPIGHYRTTERATADGKPVMFVEEMQSDWHQAGRQKGYAGEADILSSQEALEKARAKLIPLVRQDELGGHDTVGDALAELRGLVNGREKYGNEYSPATLEAAKEYEAAFRERARVQQAPPKAPFKETWPNLLFRQALFDAINSNKEYVAWPTGEQMAQIQGHQADRIPAHQAFYDKRVVDYANKLGKPFGAKVEKVAIGDSTSNEAEFRRGDLQASLVDYQNQMRDLLDENPNLDMEYATYVEDTQDWTPELEKYEELNEMINWTIDRLSKAPSDFKVNAMRITPQMRELVKQGGLPLFQRKKGDGSFSTPQANISLRPKERPDLGAIMRLFRTANASSAPHEFAHLWLDDMIDDAPHNRGVAADLQTLIDAINADPSIKQKITSASQIAKEHHEWVARRFEQYLRNGKAPNKALVEVFKQFAAWLKAIYKKATELGVEVSPEVQKVFDRWFAQDASINEETSSSTGVEPRPGQTLTQSGKANVDDLRGQMQRANDNVNDRSFTPDFHREMANTYKVRTDHFRKLGDQFSAFARKWGDRGNGRRAQMYARDAAEYHERADHFANLTKEHLTKANRLDSLTFNQDPVTQPPPTQNPTSMYSGYKSFKNKTRRFFNPLADLPNEAAYLDARNVAAGQTYAARQTGEQAHKLYAKLKPDEKKAVMDYWETAGASPDKIPLSARAGAVSLKNRLSEIADEMVKRGVLDADTAQANKGKYVPRLYLKYLLDNEGITGSGIKANLNNIKKRKDLSPDARVALGEVRDPAVVSYFAMFRPLRDIAILDFLKKVSTNTEWVLPKSLVEYQGQQVTPFWLESEAKDILTERAPAEKDPARKAEMQRVAQEMLDAAEPALAEASSFDPDAYKQIPNTPQFGKLRGMVVRKQIADDVIGTSEFVRADNGWDKWFGDKNSKLVRAGQIWKSAKVPWNPPSQVRNAVSNMILLNLSGVRIDMVLPRIIQAANEIRTNGKVWQEAKRLGIPNATMTEQELHGLSDSIRKMATENGGIGSWRKLMNIISSANQKVGDMYQFTEHLFKTAKMIDVMKKGGTAEEAARDANKWLFDYSLVSPEVRRMRNAPLGMPFITFQSKILPLLYEIVTKHPTRLLPYAALAYTVPGFVAASFGLEDDDVEKLRKTLSTASRKQNSMYLLPWKDDAGRWQFLNIGYFMPWQMPFDVGSHAGKGIVNAAQGKGREAGSNMADAFKSSGLGQSPLASIISALNTGIDPFTDKPIADKRDPPYEQVIGVMSYVWSLAMPSLITGVGAGGRVYDAMTGTGMNRYGEPTHTTGQIAARALGTNVTPVVPEAQRARNIKQMQREIQDEKSRMTYSLRDQGLTMEQKRSMQARFMEDIKEKQQRLVEYVRESQPSDRLRAASQRP